ncbi:hypothetical protein AZE42_10457 [Rhizopogon vesiculosus]|uniref:Uncharacterized protein n=1 Tax=Rhizopogon vesiculosus TaxID=180088 RepID=A0A1J8QGL5_9AGAM|nr:hypothetical protein AZE42_10457 [Rhizopogon vesiculosus]
MGWIGLVVPSASQQMRTPKLRSNSPDIAHMVLVVTYKTMLTHYIILRCHYWWSTTSTKVAILSLSTHNRLQVIH